MTNEEILRMFSGPDSLGPSPVFGGSLDADGTRYPPEPTVLQAAPDSAYFNEGVQNVQGVRSIWMGRTLVYEAPKRDDAVDVSDVLRWFSIIDPNAAMIRRDGPAQPKPAAIQAPLLIESLPDTAGLMVVAALGQRW
jgi:hypothetical protein